MIYKLKFKRYINRKKKYIKFDFAHIIWNVVYDVYDPLRIMYW